MDTSFLFKNNEQGTICRNVVDNPSPFATLNQEPESTTTTTFSYTSFYFLPPPPRLFL